MAAEAEQVQFQGFGFHHLHIRHIADADFCKVRLARDRAQRGEFRAVETDPVVIVRVLVFKGFQYLGGVILAVFGLVAQRLEFFGIACHLMLPPLLL